MKYIVRVTREYEFDTIEEAREFRNKNKGSANLQLIVSDRDPFGDRWDKHPNAAKAKNK